MVVHTRTPRGQGRPRLLEAAGELFAERGVSGTSLQSIADRLGVTKAAIYHQFASKDEIVIAVAEPVIAHLAELADAAASTTPQAGRAVVIAGLVDLATAQRGTAAIMRRDPSMSQILNNHEPYMVQIARIDAVLLGPDPSPERRVALAFAGGGIAVGGELAGLEPATLRTALIAAMTRALETP
jgi:AcrR family transcriptional regulator